MSAGADRHDSQMSMDDAKHRWPSMSLHLKTISDMGILDPNVTWKLWCKLPINEQCDLQGKGQGATV